jgi:SAM-dependent methyltransferase
MRSRVAPRARWGRQRGLRAVEEWAASDKKLVLHVGCGTRDVHSRFQGPEWQEVRLDIDPGVKPHIVANIVDMSCVPSASMDAVWSSHNLEHVYAHEVPLVLDEFFRVLRPGGLAAITMPDLQALAKPILAGKVEEPLYVSQSGPVAPLDVIYGHAASIERGNEFMAHRTGFTSHTLGGKLRRAGFANIQIKSEDFALWADAWKPVPKQSAAT